MSFIRAVGRLGLAVPALFSRCSMSSASVIAAAATNSAGARSPSAVTALWAARFVRLAQACGSRFSMCPTGWSPVATFTRVHFGYGGRLFIGCSPRRGRGLGVWRRRPLTVVPGRCCGKGTPLLA